MSNTQGPGQRPQNQVPPNIDKQEQARNVDRGTQRGGGAREHQPPQQREATERQPMDHHKG